MIILKILLIAYFLFLFIGIGMMFYAAILVAIDKANENDKP